MMVFSTECLMCDSLVTYGKSINNMMSSRILPAYNFLLVLVQIGENGINNLSLSFLFVQKTSVNSFGLKFCIVQA